MIKILGGFYQERLLNNEVANSGEKNFVERFKKYGERICGYRSKISEHNKVIPCLNFGEESSHKRNYYFVLFWIE